MNTNKHINRIISLGIGIGLSLVPLMITSSCHTPTEVQPNIVHIICDQLSANAVSYSGNPYVNTPNLDKLAERGIRFERAYSAHPLCVPDRASMLTGLASIDTEKRDSLGNYRSWTADELEETSIGWTMKRAGYDTPYAGKWHVVDIGNPPDHGFDYINPTSKGYYDGSSEEVNAGCRNFFENRDDKPFYLTASYIQPHGICYWGRVKRPGDWGLYLDPWPQGVDPWDEQFLGDGYPFPEPGPELESFIAKHCPPLPENFFIAEDEPEIINRTSRSDKNSKFGFYDHAGRSKDLSLEQAWRLYRWTYFRLVEQADQHVGELIDMLDEFGLTENTVIIFTSDHGEGNGGHLLKLKNTLYEEAARIPFILIDPQSEQNNVVNNTHLINNGLDIFPTVCDYAGIDIPSHVQGRSVRPFSYDENPEWRDFTVIECRHGRAVIGKDFKYTIYEQSQNYPEQFFNLRDDSSEMINLASNTKYISQLNIYRKKMEEWMEARDNPPLPRH